MLSINNNSIVYLYSCLNCVVNLDFPKSTLSPLGYVCLISARAASTGVSRVPFRLLAGQPRFDGDGCLSLQVILP